MIPIQHPATEGEPPARQLIVNADDFAATPAVSEAIVRCHREGVVTATSAMVTLKDPEASCEIARSTPSLDIGLHVDLTWGQPRSAARLPGLAPSGRFLGKRGLALAVLLGRVSAAELEDELQAQRAHCTKLFGEPSHVDFHQHVHALPAIWRAALRSFSAGGGIGWLRRPYEPGVHSLGARLVAAAFRRRLRNPGPQHADHFRGLELTGSLDRETALQLLDAIPPGLTEWMVHPGPAEGIPDHPDRLAGARAREVAALTDRRVLARIKEGFQLSDFRSQTS